MSYLQLQGRKYVTKYNNLEIIMKSRIFAILILAILGILNGSCKPHFTIKNNKIYDENGGERIFHGVNLVTKVPPYYEPEFDADDLKKLKNLGLNGIRLGVMWPGVQPKEDYFDEEYLKKMVDLVNLAGKYNIYTLVQFHQDLFSEKFCGDGVPMWAIPRQVYHSFPIPVILKHTQFDNHTGLPPDIACVKPWGEYYTTKAVNRGFGHLYKNVSGLLDKFAIYWKKVATAFKGNPYVIGYQLMNEPWPGNMYDNPLIMVPGLSQKFHLQDVYDHISNQIRKVDPDHNICYQPVTWLNDFPAGFTHPPGGKRWTNSSIFCYHYYNPPTLHLDAFMKARMRDVKRLGGAGILTEFYTIGDQGVKNIPIMDLCDTHSQSWFGWLYHYNLISDVKRTFSHRVAGTIISQSFNHNTKQYHLLYRPNKKAGKTVIYLDTASDYANSFDVHVYPTLSQAKYQLIDQVYLQVDSSQFEEDITVMIAISP